jgi:hypothetical protein
MVSLSLSSSLSLSPSLMIIGARERDKGYIICFFVIDDDEDLRWDNDVGQIELIIR